MLFSRLQRITRDGRWIPEIDGLRFIAIFSVFLFHLGTELSARFGPVPASIVFAPVHNGLRGVQLFFTISGFVLALPFARHFLAAEKPVSLRKYYLRRLTRIEPPYLVALAGCTVLYAIYHHQWHAALVHSAVSVFYLHNLVYGNTSLVNGVLWSLEVEVQFYLLAPLFMQIFRLRSFSMRLIAYAALAALSNLSEILHHSPRVDLSLPSALIYFVMGLVVADFYVRCDRHKRSSTLDILGLAALVAYFTLHATPYFWLGPLCTCVLCVAALSGNRLRRILSLRWIAITGGMCYSIYLWHLKLIEIALLLTRHAIAPQLSYAGNYLLQIVLVGIPVFALSALFFIAVERPCMDPQWPSKFWHTMTKRRSSEAESLDTNGVS